MVVCYGRPFEQNRLAKDHAKRGVLLLAVGDDGAFLLAAVGVPGENPDQNVQAELM
jgi:hypothetical protein